MNVLPRMGRARQSSPEIFGHSLSGRVLWLTVVVILLVELVMLVPSVGNERQNWLWEHVARAHLAVFSVAQSDKGRVPPATRDALLKLADALAIELAAPGQPLLVLKPDAPLPPCDRCMYLPDDNLIHSSWRASLRLFGIGGKTIEIIAPSPLQTGAVLEIYLDGNELTKDLQVYALHIAALSVIIALITGLLVFAVLDRLLVRPMQIISASIAGFREDPEQEEENGLDWLAAQPENEISRAARELKAMQDEMRAALWRNARLAAVGTSVAKISHDLRNILSSALLVADRLQDAEDPTTKRAAKMLIPAVERAAQLVSRTLDFAREGPPAITRTPVTLSELVEEAIPMVRPEDLGLNIENLVPPGLILALDRAQMYRVLLNLLRNAAEAGARTVRLTIETKGGLTRMRVSDDGPGLPQRVQDNLFKPFTSSGRYGGTGLGLAIARDLIRAHGGELVLETTGPGGTVFVMDLAVNEMQVAVPG